MKKITIASLIAIAIIFEVSANDKIIYGLDNRLDIYQSHSELYKTLARSTAAMIPAKSLKFVGNNVTITSRTLASEGVCSDVQFSSQPTAAQCSGFLVAPDLLVTAGHCIDSVKDCKNNYWVFDYGNLSEEQKVFSINKNDVYACSEIIAHDDGKSDHNDFAIIRLERKSDRTPLEMRREGKINDSTGIVVIGHSEGLPTKIADNAKVTSNKNKHSFKTNLDTFEGNSGSAVFDAQTGIVEGIFISGDEDYVYDNHARCNRPKVCTKNNDCDGEEVTRITSIPWEEIEL